MKTVKVEYEIGDIVFVSKYTYENGEKGNNHLFVVIDAERMVEMEYFVMIVSSHREKGNDVSSFLYNEPLDKNSKNGLKDDSIVKCDQVYSIPHANVQFKIGQVDIDDYLRFMNAYNMFLSRLEEKLSN